jgi:TRAP-type C4-dicarboxylate transport system permease small subunit
MQTADTREETEMVGPQLRRWLRVIASFGTFAGLGVDLVVHGGQESAAIQAGKSAIQVAQLDADFIFDALIVIGFAIALYILSRVDE